MLSTPAQMTAPLISLLCRDTIDAVADRAGETPADRASRGQAALRSIEAFEPRDAVETMIAGQAVLFECLIMDAIHDSHHAATDESAQRHRRQALSMSRTQLAWFKEFRLHRSERYPDTTKTPEVEVHPATETRTEAAPVRPVEPLAAAVPAQSQAPAGPARASEVMRAVPAVPPGVAPPMDAARIVPEARPDSQAARAGAAASAVPAQARPAMTPT